MRALTALAFALLAGFGCGEDDPILPPIDDVGLDAGTEADTGTADASSTDLGSVDAGSVDAGDGDAGMSTLVLGHERELRGLWLATVYGLDFPSTRGLDPAAMRAELESWVALAHELGFNALFFQARPESDALYASSHEPWSRYLAGAQGVDPGLDPLATLTELAHARGIEVHAWLNPYRAAASASAPLDPRHVAAIHPEHAHVYGDALWMDPGAATVRAHVLRVIRELATTQDIDGVHLDDYFYPYPVDGLDFPDALTWSAYQATGGTLSRADWRRSNVDALVESIGALLAREAPDLSFGISPFGIFRPGMPEGISGLDQFESLYANPPRWMSEGWVDYVAPQLYWPTTQSRQAFEPLFRWWDALPRTGHLFVGLNTWAVESSGSWPVSELSAQIELVRQLGSGPAGLIHFRGAKLRDGSEALRAALRAAHAQPAMTPPLPTRATTTPEPPRWDGAAFTAPEGARALLRYEGRGDEFTLVEVTGPGVAMSPTPGTRQGFSVVDRRGVESPAVIFEP